MSLEALLTWPKWDAQLVFQVLTMLVEILKSYRISHIGTKLFAIGNIFTSIFCWGGGGVCSIKFFLGKGGGWLRGGG